MDRLERLTDLVLELLRPGPPRTLAEIAEAVPGYPPPGEARRQAFERDKRTLRDQGIAVSTEAVAGPGQVGYRIRADDFYLPDLDLAPDEQVALNLAVTAVHIGDGSGQQALWRLGLPGEPGPAALAQLPILPVLPTLFGAIGARAEVRFGYRDAPRRVAPTQLRFHGGRWYLAGFDLDRQAPRTFRVDRMAGQLEVGEPGSGTAPDGVTAASAWSGVPWQAGDEDVVLVDILVDEVFAGRLVHDLGEASVVERRGDGAVVLRLSVTNVAALRTWVLDLGDHAEILSPPEVRQDLVAWLHEVIGGATRPVEDTGDLSGEDSENRPGKGSGEVPVAGSELPVVGSGEVGR